MTFSEDDLLPYNVKTLVPNAECLKTIFMQWTILEKPGLYERADFLAKEVNRSLFDLASFDPEGIDSDGLHHTPPSFASVFEQAAKDNERDDARKDTRQAGLFELVKKLFKNPRLLAEVDKIVAQEMRDENVMDEESLKKINLRTKASCLADFRLKVKMRDLPNAIGCDLTRSNDNFCIHLNRLVGGQGTSNTSTTTLFFPYATPFYEFDRILQDETQLCYIPSKTAPTSNLNTYEAVSAPVVEPSVETSTSTTSHSETEAELPENSTFVKFGTTWVRKDKPPSRAEKGYSVKDGPWVCKLVSNPPTSQGPNLYQVDDALSYVALKSTLRELMKEHPRKEHTLIVMHSKERQIWKDLATEKLFDEREFKKVEKTLIGLDGKVEDVNFEETYYEWFCRASEEREKVEHAKAVIS